MVAGSGGFWQCEKSVSGWVLGEILGFGFGRFRGGKSHWAIGFGDRLRGKSFGGGFRVVSGVETGIRGLGGGVGFTERGQKRL